MLPEELEENVPCHVCVALRLQTPRVDPDKFWDERFGLASGEVLTTLLGFKEAPTVLHRYLKMAAESNRTLGIATIICSAEDISKA